MKRKKKEYEDMMGLINSMETSVKLRLEMIEKMKADYEKITEIIAKI